MSITHHYYTTDQEKTARYAKALGLPVRVYIMDFLVKNADKCCYSGDMAEELPISRSTLSQHLKELKEAGLIQGEINPPYIKYGIMTTPALFVDGKVVLKGKVTTSEEIKQLVIKSEYSKRFKSRIFRQTWFEEIAVAYRKIYLFLIF